MSVGGKTHRGGPGYPQRVPVVAAFPCRIAVSFPIIEVSIEVQREPEFVRAGATHGRMQGFILVVILAERVAWTPA
jgi:hypothetical protein